MVRVNLRKWQQTADELRLLARDSAHPRTRERFLALYQVASGWSAMAWAAETERRHSTLLEWVGVYNERGPEAMVYRRTGGWPFFSSKMSARLSAG
jgi:hypothetical protein